MNHNHLSLRTDFIHFCFTQQENKLTDFPLVLPSTHIRKRKRVESHVPHGERRQGGHSCWKGRSGEDDRSRHHMSRGLGEASWELQGQGMKVGAEGPRRTEGALASERTPLSMLVGQKLL